MADNNVLILCVNYNTDAEVLRYADAVSSLTPPIGSLNMVCADCSPNQPSPDLQRRAGVDSTFDYLPLEANAGYFGGAAAALSMFRDRGRTLPEWIIVSNTDISFPDKDILPKLQRRHLDGNYDIVAPAITSTWTNAAQNPHMQIRPSCLRMRLLRDLANHYLAANIYQMFARLRARAAGARDTKISSSDLQVRPIYAPHGAFIIFRRTYFERGGRLEYPGFLFGEEIFVAETSRNLGLSIGYDPALRIYHDEHVSTGLSRSTFRTRESLKLARASREFLYETYFAN